MSVHQYLTEDPADTIYDTYTEDCHGYPSVDWQRQMVISKNFAYNQTNNERRPLPTWIHNTTSDNKTFFRPLQQVNVPERFEQEGENVCFDKQVVEDDDADYDKKLSTKLMEAMSDPWDPNPNLALTDFVTNLENHSKSNKEPLIDSELQQHLTHDNDNDATYLPLSTNLILKAEETHVLFPHGFR